MEFTSIIKGTQNIDTFIDNVSCTEIRVDWELNIGGSNHCANIMIKIYSVQLNGFKNNNCWSMIFANKCIENEIGEQTDFRGDIFPALAEVYEDKVKIIF